MLVSIENAQMAKTSKSENVVIFFFHIEKLCLPPPPPPIPWHVHSQSPHSFFSFSPAFQTTLHVCNGATKLHVLTPQTRYRGWRRKQSASCEATNVCWHQQQHSQCQCGWRRWLSCNRWWTWISHRCLCFHLWKQCYSSPGYILWPGKSLFSHIYFMEHFQVIYVTTTDRSAFPLSYDDAN